MAVPRFTLAELDLDFELRGRDWLPVITTAVPVGTTTGADVVVPQGDARRVLRAVVRLVADLPLDSTPDVVWTSGRSELLVHTDTISLTCTVGLLRVAIAVECDQTDGRTTISVPFAVGTPQAATGLVMQTYDRLDGPAAVTAVWADALTAFCWEALLETATRLCAEIGNDSRGRALVPGSIGSGSRVLLLRPMARHDARLRPA